MSKVTSEYRKKTAFIEIKWKYGGILGKNAFKLPRNTLIQEANLKNNAVFFSKNFLKYRPSTPSTIISRFARKIVIAGEFEQRGQTPPFLTNKVTTHRNNTVL